MPVAPGCPAAMPLVNGRSEVYDGNVFNTGEADQPAAPAMGCCGHTPPAIGCGHGRGIIPLGIICIGALE